MKRAALALSLLAFAAAAGAAEPMLSPDEQAALVQLAADKMKAKYVFPDAGQQAAASLPKTVAPAGPRSAREFAALLTRELRASTHDKHIVVMYSAAPLPAIGEAQEEEGANDLEMWRRDAKAVNYGVVRAEQLQGNVGYIDVRAFPPLAIAAGTFAAAMNVVANTDALVIDLRHNRGGEPETVAFLCSYLFDERTHLNDLHWRRGDRLEQFWTSEWVPGVRYGRTRPVYVLTSSATFSAGEEFANDLRALKRATLIGETTGGGANPGQTYRLAEHFAIFIPTGRAINAVDRSNWEGVGVKPDVEVAAADALERAHARALHDLAAAAH